MRVASVLVSRGVPGCRHPRKTRRRVGRDSVSLFPVRGRDRGTGAVGLCSPAPSYENRALLHLYILESTRGTGSEGQGGSEGTGFEGSEGQANYPPKNRL